MRIITRYLLREFLWVLGIILVSYELIYLTVDFIEKIDNFLAAGVPFNRIVYFFLMSSPYILFNLAPVALLVSILISVGLLVRHNEIAAIKAAGVSIYRLALPILGASIVVGFFMFGLSEVIIPYSSAKANVIWSVEVTKKQDTSTGRFENVWFKGEGIIYNFRVYDSRANTLTGVSLYRINKKFSLRERIEATEARWVNDRWVFYDGVVKTYHQNGQLEVKSFDKAVFDLPEMPQDFMKSTRSAEEMDFRSLYQYANQIEAEGHNPVRYRVDLHLKIAFPLICLVMAMIGLPLAFWSEKGVGIALSIAIGVGISFVYIVFLGLSRSLGYTGLLTPIIAAWLPNLFFLPLGFMLFYLVRR